MAGTFLSGPQEGQTVSYVGDETDGLQIGDRGRVLAAAGSGCHVQWKTGRLVNRIMLVANHDIVAEGSQRDELDDSFEVVGIVSFAVRSMYDSGGSGAILRALHSEGHLSTFEAIAEEAATLVASRIRQDPSFREVLAQLDEDEGSDLVSTAATTLLRSAFGSRR